MKNNLIIYGVKSGVYKNTALNFLKIIYFLLYLAADKAEGDA